MKSLNTIALGGLVLCGIAMLVGRFFHIGNLMGIAAYFGWFLAAYSLIAYVIKSIATLIGTQAPFWKTLYPINFGLVVVAIPMLQVDDLPTIVFMGVIAMVACGISFFRWPIPYFDKKFGPIFILIVLGLAVMMTAFPLGKYLFVFVGTWLVAFSTLRLSVIK